MAARNPNNNPTDRILRLLGEMDEMKAAYDDLLQRARDMEIPLNDIMPWPNMVEFRLEMQRQGNTYLRIRPDVMRTRERMQRMRERDEARGEIVRTRHRQPIPRHRKNDVMVDSPERDYQLSADDELARQIEEDNQRIEQAAKDKQKLIDETIRAGTGKAVIMPKHIAPGNDYKPPKSSELFSRVKPKADNDG